MNKTTVQLKATFQLKKSKIGEIAVIRPAAYCKSNFAVQMRQHGRYYDASKKQQPQHRQPPTLVSEVEDELPRESEHYPPCYFELKLKRIKT